MLENLTVDCKKSTKFKLDDLYGDYHSSPDSIMRATDAVIDWKRALVCSHCDVGESCTFNHRDSGDRVFVIPPAVIPEFVKPNSVTSVPCFHASR